MVASEAIMLAKEYACKDLRPPTLSNLAERALKLKSLQNRMNLILPIVSKERHAIVPYQQVLILPSIHKVNLLFFFKENP